MESIPFADLDFDFDFDAFLVQDALCSSWERDDTDPIYNLPSLDLDLDDNFANDWFQGSSVQASHSSSSNSIETSSPPNYNDCVDVTPICLHSLENNESENL